MATNVNKHPVVIIYDRTLEPYEMELTLLSHIRAFVRDSRPFIQPRMLDFWLNTVDDIEDLRTRLEEKRQEDAA